MKIEWDKVTWYSKALAVVVFLVTFFIGFEAGSLYQQAKDYSTPAASQTQSTSGTTNPSQGTTNGVPPTATHYNGMLICSTNNDCPSGYSCLRPGPIIAGQQTPKVCVSDKQAIPL